MAFRFLTLRLAFLLVMHGLQSVGLLSIALQSIAHAQQPAKQLFGQQQKPSQQVPSAHGGYSNGCLAGAVALPIDGPYWQAMRLERNRNWGHPELVALLQDFATKSAIEDQWPGLLIGDLAQPRGGPMLTGHASHQLGLDADIWMMPMPARRLSHRERQDMSAVSVLRNGLKQINHDIWQSGHTQLLRRAASYAQVARIFVHPVIKQELCKYKGQDRNWLRKIRPWWGHHYHFHIRMKCPVNSTGCKDQAIPPKGDGCGAPIQYWLDLMFKPKKKPIKPEKPKKKKPKTLADLPPACHQVLISQ